MRNMIIPLRLIEILANGALYSAETLGEQLSISHTAINNCMQTLKEWGLDIVTISGKGYRLASPLQLLNEAIIASYLPAGSIKVLSVIDSTNQYLLDRMAMLCSGDACIAEYQQMGRGRRVRVWCSGFGSGLCFSMYWRLARGAAAATGLSLVVGIVIAEVLQDAGAKNVRVKWPNDLCLNDKKLAGILVELTGKAGDVAQVVIGVGINLFIRTLQHSPDHQNWINLQEAGIIFDRNKLVAELLSALHRAMIRFENEGLLAFIPRWRALDNYLDRSVKLLIGDKELSGIARGIDRQGALLFEQNGVIKPFTGGEISLRGI